MNYPSDKDDWKQFEKKLLLMFCKLKNRKYTLPTF